MDKVIKLHVVSHTHWDREWYLTFQQFRLRLVDLIEHLLEIMDRDPEYKYYTLDGQAIVLEDYLEIKPQHKEKLKKYIKNKRIFVGPWYILPDEFLVSGEATIRNLLLGHRIASEFGNVMKVGYLPDPFGHISQMPQILQGFGIDNTILWRGFGGEKSQDKSEYRWQAPDGSKVLMVHLPRCGYCNALNLPSDIDQAYNRIKQIRKEHWKRTATSHLLLMNGIDHVEPQPDLTKIIEGVNRRLKGARLIHSHLSQYISKVRSTNKTFSTIRGELRRGFKYTILLTGVLSTRMYLKQENAYLQTLLERWVEPFSTLVNVFTNEDYSDNVRQAWKYLLQNHPHDSICGCSIDKVHQDMMSRFSWVREIAEDLRGRALRQIGSLIDLPKISDKAEALVVYNPQSWAVTDIVSAQIDFPADSQAVFVKLCNNQGQEIPCSIGKIEKTSRLNLRPELPPELIPVVRAHVTFMADDLPPLGYRAYQAIPLRRRPSPVLPQQLAVGSNFAENEFFKVKIRSNGSLDITHKGKNYIYRGLHYFEDSADSGDEYNYSYPEQDRIITTLGTKARVGIVEKTADLVKFKIEYILTIPKSLSADRRTRSRYQVKVPIISTLLLARGLERIDVETMVDNKAGNHRLRVLFPSDIKTNVSWAEGQFDVCNRRIIKPRFTRKHVEIPANTHPQQSFIDVNDFRCGLAILNQGLPEYEVKKDERRTIALTLLRCVGDLSRGDLLTRPGNAGWTAKTPEAQCQGQHIFRYSILPHSGDWQKAKIWKSGRQYQAGLTAVQIYNGASHKKKTCHEEKLLAEMSFFKIEPDELVVSALKKCEDDDTVILRFYNIGTKTVTARLHSCRLVKKAFLTDLNEQNKSVMKMDQGQIRPFKVAPKKIVTLRLKF